MTKQSVIALILICGIIAGGFFFHLSRSEQLTYQGKSLEHWLRNGNSNETRQAMQHIGTNALPRLVRLLRSDDSRLTERLFQAARNHLPFNIPFESDMEKQFLALAGFEAMGTNAYPAIPILSNMLQEAKSPVSVAMALAITGPEAMPSLTSALTSTNYIVRFAAVSSLGVMDVQAEPAIPQIAACMKDKHKLVRFCAARALGQICVLPEKAIPVLMEGLHDPDATVRWASAESLGKFGSQAKSAVPKLIELLDDDPRFARLKVVEALKNIDPEAAAKAGIK